MKNRPWLDAIKADLTRQGLPPEYIERLMEELNDHAFDLMEEMKMNTETTHTVTPQQRIGTSDEIAEMATVNYRQTRFAGRHPWLTFFIAPIPTTALMMFVFFLLALGLFETIPWLLGDTWQVEGKAIDQWPAGLVLLARLLDLAIKFLPSVLAVIWFCRLARRGGRSIRWALPACLLVAWFSSLLQTTMQLPQIAGERGLYTVSLGFTLFPQLPKPICVLQFVVPLVVGLFLVFLYAWQAKKFDVGKQIRQSW